MIRSQRAQDSAETGKAKSHRHLDW